MITPSTAVAVVGSANLDYVVLADRTPDRGETMLGHELTEHAGGKGLNQALASARYARTAFVGAVGTDPRGDILTDALVTGGVDTRRLTRHPGQSGAAVVQVTPDAENRITVITGANDAIDADFVTEALDTLSPAVVMAQLESPFAAVVAACRWALDAERRWVLNPSPVAPLASAAPDDAHALLSAADPLIVNTGEARAVLGLRADAVASAQEIAASLLERSRSVVVTLGAEGCIVATDQEITRIPGTKVDAVDTTGAGDSFAGTLAALLSAGESLLEAAAAAGAQAAATVATHRSERHR